MNLIVLCLFAAGWYAGTALQLPPKFLKCNRSDPNINECLKSAIERAFKVMEDGLPDFNIDSIQPIKVPSITIGEGTGPVRVVQNYDNCQIFNVATAKVMEVTSTINDNEFKINATLFVKEVYMKSHYNLNGKILLLPIVGDGECTITLKNAKIPVEIIGEFVERKENQYVELATINVHLVPELVELDFKNLFNGDPKLGPEMNRILNENWQGLFDDVKHAYEDAIGGIFKNIGNQIFKKVPYDDLIA